MTSSLFEMVPTLVALLVMAGAIAGGWLIHRAWRRQLLRCPETDAVACVEVEAGEPGTTSTLARVRCCDLWPRREACAQGCLARYEGAAAGRRVDLEALRPFQRGRRSGRRDEIE